MDDEPSVLRGDSQALVVGHERAQICANHQSGRKMYGVQGSQLARIQLSSAIEHSFIKSDQPHSSQEAPSAPDAVIVSSASQRPDCLSPQQRRGRPFWPPRQKSLKSSRFRFFNY